MSLYLPPTEPGENAAFLVEDPQPNNEQAVRTWIETAFQEVSMAVASNNLLIERNLLSHYLTSLIDIACAASAWENASPEVVLGDEECLSHYHLAEKRSALLSQGGNAANNLATFFARAVIQEQATESENEDEAVAELEIPAP